MILPRFAQIRFLGLLLFVYGCTAVVPGSTERVSERTLTATLLVLDRAINELDNLSADSRTILQDILAALPRDSQEFIKADITTFLRRAPGAGADFKCGADFQRYTTRKELWRLKDTLLNTNPQPAQPQFCYAVPFAVDTTRPTDTVEIYGYDFDQVPLEMFMMNGDGFLENVSFALIKRTHYHLSLNLGRDGVKFSPNSQMLSVAWGHLLRYSIPLIHSTTPLCLSQVEDIPDGKTITYPPLLISGTGRFAGPGAEVWASATLDYESNKVDATLCMTAAEENGDRSTFSGCGVEYVFTSEPERVIEWVFGGLQSHITYAHGNQAEVVKEGAQGGPVRQWTFGGFAGKSPAGTEAQITVRLRGIRVVSTDTEGCVSAIAYSEAKRMNWLSPGTIERLDSQLGKVDPDILKLRPRFAPPAS